jgi:sRNA-binding carbon storage regulator CsrA
MLVLNRRPGESIVVEGGIDVTVSSVVDRKVHLRVTAPGLDQPLRLSSTALSGDEVRLEVGSPTSVRIDADEVQVDVAGDDEPAVAVDAMLSLVRRIGESVTIGDGLTVTVSAVSKGNPCLDITGPAIGFSVTVTVLRTMGSYVRVGIDAPADRRVFRKELWDDVAAANRAAADDAADDVTGDLAALVGDRPDPGGPPQP